MRAIRRFTVRPVLPKALSALEELAMNLRWSWHPATREVFHAVDPDLWDAVEHDPLRLISSVSTERLAELSEDHEFLAVLASTSAELTAYLTEARWYHTLGGEVPKAIGYFSPEFGITAVLPQYSGGLGILAGDHLKAASDLGVPIIGVGLLYRSGYFKQSLSAEGWQQETYPILDPDEQPLRPLREPDGTVAVVRLPQPDGSTLAAHVWVAQVGRVPLLLLDSDIEENPEHLRVVTDRLYGGTSEHRLLQELLLGIGGVKALRSFCRITGTPDPEVFHTNEGHAGFLGLERIRELTVAKHGPQLDFDTALEVSRAGTVFTTHTPVPAGIDRFPRDLISRYFGEHSVVPGVPHDRVLELGTESYPGGDGSVFNMAVMGLRLAQRANGVSGLHGRVSRDMFNGLWSEFDADEIPIGSITNGVHAPTWISPEATTILGKHGMEIGRQAPDEVLGLIDSLSPGEMWAAKRRMRQRLVVEARKRLAASWAERGASAAELGWIDSVLDPDVLTIGFARRVPSYKRLTLMLRDPERLKGLLLHPDHPVQLVIAGKSHPADDGGKRLIQEVVQFADDPEVRHRIVFLPNYDIAMALPLYPGCDVWLNNPLRPYEACGTSGMKAALNGGLNLSILDGWWDEWYDGDNGWAIPSADGVSDPSHRDDIEARALYDLIENDVAPRFYDVDQEGIPNGWLEMLRHTLRSLGPKVLASRMVRDYVNQLYAPAAGQAREMNSDFAGAGALAGWKKRVRSAWSGVHVDHVESIGVSDIPEVGQSLDIRSEISLGELLPDDVSVQAVLGRLGEDDELIDVTIAPLTAAERLGSGRYRYEGHIALVRAGAIGYTVRVIPGHPLLASPAEMGLVALPG